MSTKIYDAYRIKCNTIQCQRRTTILREYRDPTGLIASVKIALNK